MSLRPAKSFQPYRVGRLSSRLDEVLRAGQVRSISTRSVVPRLYPWSTNEEMAVREQILQSELSEAEREADNVPRGVALDDAVQGIPVDLQESEEMQAIRLAQKMLHDELQDLENELGATPAGVPVEPLDEEALRKELADVTKAEIALQDRIYKLGLVQSELEQQVKVQGSDLAKHEALWKECERLLAECRGDKYKLFLGDLGIHAKIIADEGFAAIEAGEDDFFKAVKQYSNAWKADVPKSCEASKRIVSAGLALLKAGETAPVAVRLIIERKIGKNIGKNMWC